MKCPLFNVSMWRRAHCRSALVVPDSFHSSTSFFVRVEDLYRRSFAPSQVNMKCSFSESGSGSFSKAHLTESTHAILLSYTRQFANCSKKVLDAVGERTDDVRRQKRTFRYLAIANHAQLTVFRDNYKLSHS